MKMREPEEILIDLIRGRIRETLRRKAADSPREDLRGKYLDAVNAICGCDLWALENTSRGTMNMAPMDKLIRETKEVLAIEDLAVEVTVGRIRPVIDEKVAQSKKPDLFSKYMEAASSICEYNFDSSQAAPDYLGPSELNRLIRDLELINELKKSALRKESAEKATRAAY